MSFQVIKRGQVGGMRGGKGNPGGNVMAVGPFVGISGMEIRIGALMVQTSEFWPGSGVGGARYVRDDSLVDDAYVTAHPLASFRALDENGTAHGYRISEAMPNVQMFGAIGGDVSKDNPAIQYASKLGKIIYFPTTLTGSIYYISEAIVPVPGSRFVGLGDWDSPTGRVKLEMIAAANDNMLRTPFADTGNTADRNHYFTLEGLSFYANGQAQTVANNAIEWDGTFIGSLINYVGIFQAFGPALEMNFADTTVGTLWISGVCTDSYAVTAINSNIVCQGGIYIENVSITNSGAWQLDIPALRTTAGSYMRGKGIYLTTATTFCSIFLHMESIRVGIHLDGAYSLFIGRLDTTTLGYAGAVAENDNCAVGDLGGLASCKVDIFSWFAYNSDPTARFFGRSSTSIASNAVAQTPAGVLLSRGLHLAGTSNSPDYERWHAAAMFTNYINVEPANTAQPAGIRIWPSGSTASAVICDFRATPAGMSIGSTSNQAANARKEFIRFVTSGDSAERIEIRDPLRWISGRTSTMNIPALSLYPGGAAGTVPTWQAAGGARSLTTNLIGTASPIGVVTPEYIGQTFIDTTNKHSYDACGATSADWVQAA